MRLFRITLCAALLACSTTAFARSDAELRDMAATFGLTPAQSDILFTRLVRQQERINALAARWSINSKTLRAASIALGATSSALSDQDFLKLVAVKAEQAKLASDRIASLSEELARLDPGGIRTKALALLAGGEAAFNAGRLDEAASAFAKIEALRLDQLAGGHDAWVEAVFANALVSDVKGDPRQRGPDIRQGHRRCRQPGGAKPQRRVGLPIGQGARLVHRTHNAWATARH